MIISAVGDEFNFLNNLEYIYDHSGSESETPGPFSRSYQALDAEAELDDGSVTKSLHYINLVTSSS